MSGTPFRYNSKAQYYQDEEQMNKVLPFSNYSLTNHTFSGTISYQDGLNDCFYEIIFNEKFDQIEKGYVSTGQETFKFGKKYVCN